MPIKSMIALGAVLLTTPAVAQITAAQTTAAPTAAAPTAAAQTAAVPAPAATPDPADKQVCRREQQVGSIMPFKRVCHTRAQWLTIDRDSSAATQNAIVRRGNNQSGSNGTRGF